MAADKSGLELIRGFIFIILGSLIYVKTLATYVQNRYMGTPVICVY